MAITINWPTKVISVPRADMMLTQTSPFEIRELNIETFRLTLRDLEDNIEGMPFPRTHKHNTEVTLGSLVLARVIEIVNGYTITFEDGNYAVDIVGANNNIADAVNLNQVQVRSYNSAGLIKVTSGSGLSTEEHDQLMQIENPPSQNLDDYKADVSELATISANIDTIITSLTNIDLMIVVIQKLTGNKVTKVGDVITIYENNGTSVWRRYNLANGGRVQV